MATFKRSLPSRDAITLVFAACAFPVYTWSILRFLERMPGWLFYLNLWDVLTIFTYTQVFAFAESIVLLLGLVGLAALLPARIFRDNFVAVGSMVVLLTAGWAVAAQYNDEVLRTLPMKTLLVVVLTYAASIALAYILVWHSERVRAVLNTVAERLVALLYVYVPISLLSLGIVILRNV